MTTDPIADLLTRMRNALSSRQETVQVPHSKMKLAILDVLKKHNFVIEVNEVKSGKFDELEITLNTEKKWLTFKKVSKPGQRIYVKSSTIRKVNGGMGVAILSTPKGIMSGEDAKKLKLGGELICEVF